MTAALPAAARRPSRPGPFCLGRFSLGPFCLGTACLALLAACSAADAPPAAVGAPLVAMAETAPPAAAAAAPAPAPVPAASGVIGRGFAQVSGQPGKTLGERRLLAVRAARLEALRDLAEQVRGIRLDAETLVDDAVVRDDRLSASIETTLRGARTVSIQPRGEDGYVVVMELDAASLALVLRMARAGA